MSSLGSSAASSSPWIPRPYLHPLKFHKFQSCPPPPCFRVVCGGGGGGVSAEGSNPHHHHVARYVSFILHDALESSGILASHARVKRTSPIFLFSFVQFSDALKNGLKSVSRKEGRDSVLRSGNSRTSRGKPVFFFN